MTRWNRFLSRRGSPEILPPRGRRHRWRQADPVRRRLFITRSSNFHRDAESYGTRTPETQGGPQMADDLATPTSDQLEFDPNDLRAKYQAERDKRLRAEGDTAWIGRVVDDI